MPIFTTITSAPIVAFLASLNKVSFVVLSALYPWANVSELGNAVFNPSNTETASSVFPCATQKSNMSSLLMAYNPIIAIFVFLLNGKRFLLFFNITIEPDAASLAIFLLASVNKFSFSLVSLQYL